MWLDESLGYIMDLGLKVRVALVSGGIRGLVVLTALALAEDGRG